jgi:hypothetical protein
MCGEISFHVFRRWGKPVAQAKIEVCLETEETETVEWHVAQFAAQGEGKASSFYGG